MKTNRPKTKLLGMSFHLMAGISPVFGDGNRITDGGFESFEEEVSFVTGYTYSEDDLTPAGTYSVVTDPHAVHEGFVSMPDHTREDGTGHMLVVNGSTDAATGNVLVWSQEIAAIEANADYLFTAWAANVAERSPSVFVFKVNDVEVKSDTLPTEAGVWRSYTAEWNSGNDESAVLEIFFTSTESSGNDTALDDLAFFKIADKDLSLAISRAVWLEWDSVDGAPYQVQGTSDPAEGRWEVAADVVGTGARMRYCERITESRRFFKVVPLE